MLRTTLHCETLIWDLDSFNGNDNGYEYGLDDENGSTKR